MNIKHLSKVALTIIYHPIAFMYLTLKGSRNFTIGKRGRINRLSYLTIGNGSDIGYDCRFIFVDSYAGESYSPGLDIGVEVSIGNRFTVLSASKIRIEDRCLIADDTCIASHNHGMNPERADTYADTPLEAEPVVIKKGCWLGEKVTILPGVTLGEKSIVAAGAVVTKSFPEYSLIGGVPAKLLKTYNLKTHQWERVDEN